MHKRHEPVDDAIWLPLNNAFEHAECYLQINKKRERCINIFSCKCQRMHFQSKIRPVNNLGERRRWLLRWEVFNPLYTAIQFKRVWSKLHFHKIIMKLLKLRALALSLWPFVWINFLHANVHTFIPLMVVRGLPS